MHSACMWSTLSHSLLSNLRFLPNFMSPHHSPCPSGATYSYNSDFSISVATTHHIVNAGPITTKRAASSMATESQGHSVSWHCVYSGHPYVGCPEFPGMECECEHSLSGHVISAAQCILA